MKYPPAAAPLAIFMLFSTTLLGGCARQIGSDAYSSASVGEAMQTYSGVIVHSKNVMVEGSDSLEENGLGMGVGAVMGLIGGSQMGKGSGSAAMAVAGGVLGGAAGAMAEKELKKQPGIEYAIRTDDGRMLTVVQGPQPQLAVGQRVLVHISTRKGGRSRVIADHSLQTPGH